MEQIRPLTAAGARALDRAAQEVLLLPGDLLMENAGAHVAREAHVLATDCAISRVVVLCGPGNNGGDGFVAARHLVDRFAVEVLLLGDPLRIAGDARRNLERLERVGVAVRTIETVEDVVACLTALPPPLVVDALFGIGMTRPLDGLALAVVRAVNAADSEVLAVDVPSGLHTDTGEPLGAAIRADVTVTFVATKVGFGLARGPEHCGRIVVAPIGFPPARLAPESS